MSRRTFLAAGSAVGGAWLLAACTSGAKTLVTSRSAVPSTTGTFPLGALEGGHIVTDPALIPATYHEAPALAALVKQGKLPPVEERIGPNPLVIAPAHEVGQYSDVDVMRRGMTGFDYNNPARFMTGPTPYVANVNATNEGTEYAGWMAKSFEQNADATEFILHLREGMKWSDGEPLTADDVMFWYEDLYTNDLFGIYPDPGLRINGKDVTVQRIDDFTVRYSFPEPYYLFTSYLMINDQSGGTAANIQPKHYLQQFHPTYVGQAKAEKLAKDATGTADVPGYFDVLTDIFLNADVPVMGPWKTVKGKEINSNSEYAVERNPYSIMVDTAGNQLPYIGTISFSVVGDTESLNLSAAAGEYDTADRGLDMLKLPFLIKNKAQGDYDLHFDPSKDVDFGLRTNLAYVDDPEIGDLLRTADFRRALSMGIDRDQLVQAFFLGAGTPSANVPTPDNIYSPGAEYVTKWATLDIEQSNQLLDDLGLKMGSDGYRQRRDGKGRLRLDFTGATASFADWASMGEMIKQHWIKIGVDLNVAALSGTLIVERALANQLQLSGHQLYTHDLFLEATTAFPSDPYSYTGLNGIPYAKWFISNGQAGTEPFPDLKALMELWRKGFAAPEAERIKIGKEWWAKSADLCLQIGCVAQTLIAYGIHLTKTNVGNVPARVDPTLAMMDALPMTFYYR